MRMIFVSNRDGGLGAGDFYMSHRTNPNDDLSWGPPVHLSEISSPADEFGPWGFINRQTGALTLYFNSARAGAVGPQDIYTTTQQADGRFSTPVRVEELSSASNELWPIVRADGLEIFIVSNRPGGMGGFDVWSSARGSVNEPWSPPVNIGPTINTSSGEQRPSITGDGMEMVFFSPRAGGLGEPDMYETRRRHGALVPVAGSLTGAMGQTFRTSAILSNPSASPISGTIIFRRAGAQPASSDPSMTYTLAPFETVSHSDLFARLGASGLGTLEIYPTSGTMPTVVTRIENGGSMVVPSVTDANVLTTGSRASLAVPDLTRSRFNIGVRTLAAGATISFHVYSESGVEIRSMTHTIAANTFMQMSAAGLLGGSLGEGRSVVVVVHAGSALVYGASVPNSGPGASLQLAQRSSD